MRSVAVKLDQPDLHDQVERADNAAAVEDDGLFLEAVGKFLEGVAQSQR